MFMIDLPLNASKLMRFANRQGHPLTPDEDFGYMAHAWLAASLGDLAPRPFRLLEKRDGLHLLGYGQHDALELCDHTCSFAEPTAMEVCDWSAAASKNMPDQWQKGRRLGFEVRACPVSRAEHERDVFLAALERSKAAGHTPPARTLVYLDWLAQSMQAAIVSEDVFVDKNGISQAPIVEFPPGSVSLSAFRRVSVLRQTHKNRQSGHGRVERPDAVFTGSLIIRDPERFGRLLARGIGRHLAFGFGMLLLRPPSR